MKKISYLFVIYVSVISLLFTHTVPVYAGIVDTRELLNEIHVEQSKERLLDILSRKDARMLLEQNGVTHEQAQERINSMTNVEIHQLAQDFENLPAAGNVGTAAALLILILVILVLALR